MSSEKGDSGIVSDFLLRAIRIKNDGSDIIRIREISFDLRIKDRIV